MTVASVFVFVGTLALYSIGGFAFQLDRRWHERLAKPVWAPSNRALAGFWLAAYMLVALAAAVVQSDPGWFAESAWLPLLLAANWLANQSYSYFLYQRKELGGAFLAVLIAALTAFFLLAGLTGVNKTAAWLLFPYLLWCCFATFLTWLLFLLNRR